MAGVLKVRDAGGTLRTITSLKVRDSAGVLRTITSAKVRDAAGVLREFFNSGGGGGGGNPASITPGFSFQTGKPASASASFTAHSSGSAPTVFAWGVLDGQGYVSGPLNQATAVCVVYTSGAAEEVATFYCDMTIDGIVYRATCVFDYYCTSKG